MAKLNPCMVCEKRYAEMEEAEVCERSHGMIRKPRPKLLAKRDAASSKASDWRKVRAVVLARDKHHCRACGLSHGLDVHHVIARSLGGRDEADNLIALCRECHQSVHGHVLKLHGASAASLRLEWVR